MPRRMPIFCRRGRLLSKSQNTMIIPSSEPRTNPRKNCPMPDELRCSPAPLPSPSAKTQRGTGTTPSAAIAGSATVRRGCASAISRTLLDPPPVALAPQRKPPHRIAAQLSIQRWIWQPRRPRGLRIPRHRLAADAPRRLPGSASRGGGQNQELWRHERQQARV